MYVGEEGERVSYVFLSNIVGKLILYLMGYIYI